MHPQSLRLRRSSTRMGKWKQRRTAAIAGSLVAVLAVTPTTAVIAAAPAAGGGASSPASVSLPLGELEKLLSQGEVDALLTGLPLSDLDLNELVQQLSELPGFATLLPQLGGIGTLRGALTTAIEELGPNATLGELANPETLVPKLQGALNGSLGGLLSTVLGGNPATILTGALGSLDEGQLLGSLLGSSADPVQLSEELLAKLDPSTLTGLLGSTVAGGPVSKTTVGALAEELGTNANTLAGDMGKTPEELPATAMALTTGLTNGHTLGLLDGLSGLTVGVMNPGSGGGESGGGGGTGGTGGGSGGGGSGGSAGSGGSPGQGPGTTTIVVNMPAGQTPAGVPRSGSSAGSGGIRILSHRVKGRVATVVVQTPTAGKLTLGGNHVRSSSALPGRAERVTLRVTLAKATATSLHRRHKHLAVKLKATFKPIRGTGSSAAVTVTFA